MAEKTIEFFTFEEVIKLIATAPDSDFIGIRFVAPYSELEMYVVGPLDPEDDEHIPIWYSGGKLFDSCGVEGAYGLDDVPDEAKTLFYARRTDLRDGVPGIEDTTGEHSLEMLFPQLDAENGIYEKADFKQEASDAFRSFWRQQ